MTPEKEIEFLKHGIEVLTVIINVAYDGFDEFLTHHIAGTVDQKVLMRARASMPPRSANALTKQGKQ